MKDSAKVYPELSRKYLYEEGLMMFKPQMSLIEKMAYLPESEIMRGMVMNQDQITAYYAGLAGGLKIMQSALVAHRGSLNAEEWEVIYETLISEIAQAKNEANARLTGQPMKKDDSEF